MRILHIKQTDGDEVWINPMHIVAIEPDGDGSVIRTAGIRAYGDGLHRPVVTAPLTYNTDEAPADLLVRLRVESGGAK